MSNNNVNKKDRVLELAIALMGVIGIFTIGAMVGIILKGVF